MNIQMPIMNGFEATLKLTRSVEVGLVENLCPIIGSSGHTSEKYRTRCKEVGMSDFLPIPHEFEDIKRILANYLAVGR